MELKEFIKTALTDIVEGVKLASESLNNDVALCYHTDRAYNGYPSVTYKTELREKQAPLTLVGFKVQIQVSTKQSVDGNIRTNVLNVLGGEVDGEVSHTNAIVQELSFSIPMVWKKR